MLWVIIRRKIQKKISFFSRFGRASRALLAFAFGLRGYEPDKPQALSTSKSIYLAFEYYLTSFHSLTYILRSYLSICRDLYSS